MGLYVSATIAGKPYQNAIVLPRAALYGRDKVFTITADNTLEERTVEIVADGRDTVTIASGISAGERVVTSPLRGAGDGDEVSPADPLLDTPGSVKSDEPAPTTGATARNVTSGD